MEILDTHSRVHIYLPALGPEGVHEFGIDFAEGLVGQGYHGTGLGFTEGGQRNVWFVAVVHIREGVVTMSPAAHLDADTPPPTPAPLPVIPPPPSTVVGTTRSYATGQAVPQASLHLDFAGAPVVSGTSRDDGTFSLEATPQEYELTANAQGFCRGMIRQPCDVRTCL